MRPSRLDAIDVARGLALVAMAAYHFTWDLAYFGVVAPSTPFTPPMRVASHVIGAAFLGLAGVSLALAHAGGFRPRNYAKRLLRIGAAAALVTAASYAVAPQTPIGFGILHCIFVASLLAAPFLIGPGSRLAAFPPPSWGRVREGGSFILKAWGFSPPPQPSPIKGEGVSAAALATGLAIIVLPFLMATPAFDPPWLVWLGLGTREPATLDWRPLAPWGGVLILGLALARLAPPLPIWRARAAPPRALAWAGRHSLALYLIHQPVLLGLLYAGVELSGVSERLSVENYAKACRPACVEAGGEIEACDRACACVVRDASAAGLGGRLAAHSLSAEERRRIGTIVQTCGSQAP